MKSICKLQVKKIVQFLFRWNGLEHASGVATLHSYFSITLIILY